MTHNEIFDLYKRREEEREQRLEEEKLTSQVQLNGFVMFAEAQRKELKKANPKMRVQEMMDLIKQKWEEMGQRAKDKCEQTA